MTGEPAAIRTAPRGGSGPRARVRCTGGGLLQKTTRVGPYQEHGPSGYDARALSASGQTGVICRTRGQQHHRVDRRYPARSLFRTPAGKGSSS